MEVLKRTIFLIGLLILLILVGSPLWATPAEELVLEVLGYMEQTEDFVLVEAPIVVQEFWHLQMVQIKIAIFGGLGALLIGILLLILGHNTGEPACFAIGIPSGILGLIVFPMGLYYLWKITTVPRMYLIEYLLSFL